MSTAMEFNNISKLYRLGLVSIGTIAHDLKRWWTINIRGQEDPYLKIGETNDRTVKGESDYVWALKDIDFKVEQGDVVGIIGKNGAGKSTLLKILSKVTAPTTGTIKAKGRIGSLLEVGTGFHPEMTGRENIYLNGAILGMTKQEIAKKLDEIVDFSGCERYIDTPVKRYSSGMMVRLGFAVAAHLDPEILVVDEVLAVGDAEFQKKAIGKMQDVSRGEGRTVLFVSHNLQSIRALCQIGVLLDQGQIRCLGTINDVLDEYLSNVETNRLVTNAVIGDEDRTKDRSLDVQFLSCKQVNESGAYSTIDEIKLIVVVKGNKDRSQCRINCTICNIDGSPVGSLLSRHFFDIREGETKTFEYTIGPTNLAYGFYTISLYMGVGDVTTGLKDYDGVKDVLSFEIDKVSNSLYYGKWSRSWGEIYIPGGSLKEL